MDKSKIIIALHSLAPHGLDRPVPVIGASNQTVGYGRYDEKANRHVLRMSLDEWEQKGEGIIKFGTTPTTQWLPLVELKEEHKDMKQSPAEAAGYLVEPTHATLPDKLPEEVTPGHLTLPEGTDTTHVPEEPPTPGEQRTATDDHRILSVQDVVKPLGEEDDRPRVLPTNAPGTDTRTHAPDEVAEASLDEAPNLNAQPTPEEQRHSTTDPRILTVQDVVVESDSSPVLGEPGSEKAVAKAQLKEEKESKKGDRNADLDEVGTDFRKLRDIAKKEHISVPHDVKTPKDLRAVIELRREEKAGK